MIDKNKLDRWLDVKFTFIPATKPAKKTKSKTNGKKSSALIEKTKPSHCKTKQS
jgi:hypothetical protein